MALWPFGKKKDDKTEQDTPAAAENSASAQTPETPEVPEAPSAPEAPESPDTTADAELSADAPVADTDADAVAAGTASPAGDAAPAVVPHDAVGGDTGPFDGDSVDIEEFDFSDYSTGVLNLGSMKLPLPKGSQVQVEMGEQGPRMLHIVTKVGRITPVAFAAPNQGGQWEDASQEILDGMVRDGMTPEFVAGPWGREVTAVQGKNTLRILGVDGPRWMLRMTLASTNESAAELADIAHGLAARTFVYRGDEPVLAGNSLPVALPAQLVEQVQKAMKQREEQARLQKQSDQAQSQRHDSQAIDDAAAALRNLGKNNDGSSN